MERMGLNIKIIITFLGFLGRNLMKCLKLHTASQSHMVSFCN